MPNHVQNRLKFIGDYKDISKIMDFITGDSHGIDFNTIIPMPEILKGYTPHLGITTAIKKFNNVPLNNNPLLAALEKTNRENQSLNFKNEEEQKAFELGLRVYEETGYVYWYDWAIANWGTKWNAYSQPDTRNTFNTLFFQTAWSGVPDLIENLYQMFPTINIEYDYADEDLGCNTAKCYTHDCIFYKSFLLDQSKEAYDLAFELWPEEEEYYKLVDGVYEYIED